MVAFVALVGLLGEGLEYTYEVIALSLAWITLLVMGGSDRCDPPR